MKNKPLVYTAGFVLLIVLSIILGIISLLNLDFIKTLILMAMSFACLTIALSLASHFQKEQDK